MLWHFYLVGGCLGKFDFCGWISRWVVWAGFDGHRDFATSGAGGFGYDPLFVLDGFTQSFAELGEDVKNKISHRAKALAKLKFYFTTR